MSEQQVLAQETPIAVYDPFRSQLSELQEWNSTAVFDYEDAKGNKEARSHVHKLRKTKTAIDKARKAEKEESLNYGRRVDAEAKELISVVEEMIEVHAKPLAEIEQREIDRAARIHTKVAEVEHFTTVELHELNSSEVAGLLETLTAITVDESFEERMAEATKMKAQAVERLESVFQLRQTAEAERAELERLREQQAEQQRKDEQERIAKEMAAKEIEKAEEERKAAEVAKIAAENEAKRQKEAAEIAAKEAAERAEREKQEAIEQVKREAEEKAAADKAAEEARERNKKHKAKIHKAAIACLLDHVDEAAAKSIVEAIANGDVAHVSISY